MTLPPPSVVVRRLSDLIHCTVLMGNPVTAAGYLRSGRPPEIGRFRMAGLSFEARKQDWLAIREVLVNDEYACMERILAPASAPRVLDIGANIGCFALRVFAAFPGAQVASVEAARDTFEVLQANRRHNPDRDWTVMNRGVWGDDRPLTIERRGIAMGHRVVEGAGADSVQGITLEGVIDAMGWSHVDLLKIDIEGGEESVIPGGAGVLARTATLVVEVHNDRIDSGPVMDTLRKVFRHAWQLNDRRSAKPLYVCSHAPLQLDGRAAPLEI